MKKLILLSIGLVLLPLMVMAQSVPGFSYQAIARDANGDVISEQQVGIQISILENSVDGPLAYMEEFYPTTNEFGIINLTIGTGSATYGNFESIDWSVGQYFVGVAMDTEGGQEFVDMSTSQLLSVPYAMYAKSAESAKSVDNIDAKTINDLKQSLSDVQTQLKSINYELMGSGTFVDARDNEIYTWVETEDNEIWMADNLRADIYTDSTVISGAMDYNGDPSISEEYGKLYTYEAIVESGKNICPDGYRMPTDAEWSALLTKYGGPVFAGAIPVWITLCIILKAPFFKRAASQRTLSRLTLTLIATQLYLC